MFRPIARWPSGKVRCVMSEKPAEPTSEYRANRGAAGAGGVGVQGIRGGEVVEQFVRSVIPTRRHPPTRLSRCIAHRKELAHVVLYHPHPASLLVALAVALAGAEIRPHTRLPFVTVQPSPWTPSSANAVRPELTWRRCREGDARGAQSYQGAAGRARHPTRTDDRRAFLNPHTTLGRAP